MALGNLIPTSIRTVATSVCSSTLAESQVPDPDHHGNHRDVQYKRQYVRSDTEVWELPDFILVGKRRKPDSKGSVAGATANSTACS